MQKSKQVDRSDLIVVNAQTKAAEQIEKERKKRKKGDYILADDIRKDLESCGVIIEDKGDKTTWKYK